MYLHLCEGFELEKESLLVVQVYGEDEASHCKEFQIQKYLALFYCTHKTQRKSE